MIDLDPFLATPAPSKEPSATSTRVFVDGPGGLHVPVWKIALSGGEPPLHAYDTSRPGGCDAFAKACRFLRDEWIRARDVRSTGRSATVVLGRRHDAMELPSTLVRETRRETAPSRRCTLMP